jgi:hypothetical protein
MASPPLGIRKVPVIRRAPLRIHRILERLTCREFDGFCSRNLQRFTGPRVATGARRTLAGAEGAKADQLNTVAFSNGLRHDGDKRVNGLAGRGLACADGQCDSVNQFLLVHIHSLRFYLTSRRRGCIASASRYRRRWSEANHMAVTVFNNADMRPLDHENSGRIRRRRRFPRAWPGGARTGVGMLLTDDTQPVVLLASHHRRSPARYACAARDTRQAIVLPATSDLPYIPILGGEFMTWVEDSLDTDPVGRRTRWCSAPRALLCLTPNTERPA